MAKQKSFKISIEYLNLADMYFEHGKTMPGPHEYPYEEIKRISRLVQSFMSKRLAVTHAIISRPSEIVYQTEESKSRYGPVDMHLLNEQYEHFCAVLDSLDIQVIDIGPMPPSLPDGIFVEDQIEIVEDIAIIGRSGEKRRYEERFYIAETIQDFIRDVRFIKSPGYLEFGDVLRVDIPHSLLTWPVPYKAFYFVGISRRTNFDGMRQFDEVVRPLGYKVIPISVPDNLLHLKTGMTQVSPGHVIIFENFLGDIMEQIHSYILYYGFKRMCSSVYGIDLHAANLLGFQAFDKEVIIMPAGFAKVAQTIQKQKPAKGKEPYTIIELQASEIMKLDAGWTCCCELFSCP